MPTRHYSIKRSKRIKKPPLGLIPERLHKALRLKEIRGAIKRYSDANMDLPSEWVEEYTKLYKELKNGQSN